MKFKKKILCSLVIAAITCCSGGKEVHGSSSQSVDCELKNFNNCWEKSLISTLSLRSYQGDKKRYTTSDFKVINVDGESNYYPEALPYLRNEIYARKGYVFKTQLMKDFFSKMPWYKPTAKKVTLNEIELWNVNQIKEIEKQQNNDSLPVKSGSYHAERTITQAGSCKINGKKKTISKSTLDIEANETSFKIDLDDPHGGDYIYAQYVGSNKANVSITMTTRCDDHDFQTYTAKTTASISNNIIKIHNYTIKWCDYSCAFTESWILTPSED